MMNPMDYIGVKGTTTAPYWRIRHGAVDRDTALAVPVMLATKLQNSGRSVDFAAPWGKGHGGDYDPDEFFAWVDQICRQRQAIHPRLEPQADRRRLSLDQPPLSSSFAGHPLSRHRRFVATNVGRALVGRSHLRAPPERSATLPGPPARTLKLDKPGCGPG